MKTTTDANPKSTSQAIAAVLAAVGVAITWIGIAGVGDVSRLIAAGFYLAVVSVALLVIGRDARDRWTLAVRLLAGIALVGTGAVTVLSVALCGFAILALEPCRG